MVEKSVKLKYGENPHQKATWLQPSHTILLDDSYLSFNDVININLGFGFLRYFSEPLGVIIKHANIVGLSVSESFSIRWREAVKTDSRAANNGILMVNHSLTIANIREIESFPFDGVVAPAYEKNTKSSLRLLTMRNTNLFDLPRTKVIDLFDGSKLVQDTFFSAIRCLNDFDIYKGSKPSTFKEQDVLVAWYAACSIKTNCAVIVKEGQTIAVAAGHQDGVTAIEHAIHKAYYHANEQDLKNSVIAVDGNFPHDIPYEQILKANISAFILPGLAENDEILLEQFMNSNCSVLFSKERCFYH
ncbi:hypothetical protein J7E78_11250 [Paenibacillus polymyxa]|uniref:hypothetical protein n=1 Tax=Paenibacillus polymyxa TaxID=1406 RepID=UPI001BE78D3B|nr:hypothetical protein [Paenibacillus polymyxa]MBT2284116.1 hypothetical protein [Paenibacillus polymyxa]